MTAQFMEYGLQHIPFYFRLEASNQSLYHVNIIAASLALFSIYHYFNIDIVILN